MLREVTRLLAPVAVVCSGLAALPALAADAPAERPAYNVGYLWPVAGATHELLRIEQDVYVFVAGDAEIRLTKNLALVSARRGADFLDIMAPASIVWPLRADAWGRAPSGWRASRPPDLTLWRSFTMGYQRLIWSVDGADDFTLATGTVRAIRILYRMVATALASPDVVEWEIAMWYAPDLGVFVKGVDRTFGLVNFELDRSANVATLRRAAGLPPLVTFPPLDHRARHREAATTLGCGLRCPSTGARVGP